MNKLYKYILIGIALFSLCFAQTKADYNGYSFIQTGINANSYGFNFAKNGGRSVKILTNTQTTGYVCFNYNYYSQNTTPSFYLYTCDTDYSNAYNLDIQSDCTNLGEIVKITDNNSWSNNYYCYTVSGKPYLFVSRGTATSNTINFYYKYYYYIPSGVTADNIQGFTAIEKICEVCQECEECTEMTQAQCEQNYNLIPINSVDNSYCELNGLCTICGGSSGEINTGTNRSSLFVNGTQINSNAIIDIYADDRLNTEVEYLNDTVDINITQNIDTSYIEGVKNNEKLTPTNEDVEYMIQGLQVYIPYIFIGLIIVYTLYLIKKFFRG